MLLRYLAEADEVVGCVVYRQALLAEWGNLVVGNNVVLRGGVLLELVLLGLDYGGLSVDFCVKLRQLRFRDFSERITLAGVEADSFGSVGDGRADGGLVGSDTESGGSLVNLPRKIFRIRDYFAIFNK